MDIALLHEKIGKAAKFLKEANGINNDRHHCILLSETMDAIYHKAHDLHLMLLALETPFNNAVRREFGEDAYEATPFASGSENPSVWVDWLKRFEPKAPYKPIPASTVVQISTGEPFF